MLHKIKNNYLNLSLITVSVDCGHNSYGSILNKLCLQYSSLHPTFTKNNHRMKVNHPIYIKSWESALEVG